MTQTEAAVPDAAAQAARTRDQVEKRARVLYAAALTLAAAEATGQATSTMRRTVEAASEALATFLATTAKAGLLALATGIYLDARVLGMKPRQTRDQLTQQLESHLPHPPKGPDAHARKLAQDALTFAKAHVKDSLTNHPTLDPTLPVTHDAETPAETISRSKATQLAAESQLELQPIVEKALGISLSKIWLTRGDDKVRPQHRALHGKTKPADKPFHRWLGKDQQLRYPGDPDAPAEATANCRCSLWWTAKVDAAAAEKVLSPPDTTNESFPAVAASAAPTGVSIIGPPVEIPGLGLFVPAVPGVTAASTPRWTPGLHPRGADGRFIEKFGIIEFLAGPHKGTRGVVEGNDDDQLQIRVGGSGGELVPAQASDVRQVEAPKARLEPTPASEPAPPSARTADPSAWDTWEPQAYDKRTAGAAIRKLQKEGGRDPKIDTDALRDWAFQFNNAWLDDGDSPTGSVAHGTTTYTTPDGVEIPADVAMSYSPLPWDPSSRGEYAKEQARARAEDSGGAKIRNYLLDNGIDETALHDAAQAANEGRTIPATPEADLLRQAVGYWTQDPTMEQDQTGGWNADLAKASRYGISGTLDRDPMPEWVALHSAIAAPTTNQPLYRGVKTKDLEWNERSGEMKTFIDNLKVGDTFELSPTSWTSDSAVAELFAQNNPEIDVPYNPDDWLDGRTIDEAHGDAPDFAGSVVFQLLPAEGGTHALNLSQLQGKYYQSQKEWATGGKLRVLRREQPSPTGPEIITLVQDDLSYGEQAPGQRELDATFAVTAASSGRFNPDLHPRGKDGKFIEVFGLVDIFNQHGFQHGQRGNPAVRGKVTSITPDPDHPGDPIITVEVQDDRWDAGKFGSTVSVRREDVTQAGAAKAKATLPTKKPKTPTHDAGIALERTPLPGATPHAQGPHFAPLEPPAGWTTMPTEQRLQWLGTTMSEDFEAWRGEPVQFDFTGFDTGNALNLANTYRELANWDPDTARRVDGILASHKGSNGLKPSAIAVAHPGTDHPGGIGPKVKPSAIVLGDKYYRPGSQSFWDKQKAGTLHQAHPFSVSSLTGDGTVTLSHEFGHQRQFRFLATAMSEVGQNWSPVVMPDGFGEIPDSSNWPETQALRYEIPKLTQTQYGHSKTSEGFAEAWAERLVGISSDKLDAALDEWDDYMGLADHLPADRHPSTTVLPFADLTPEEQDGFWQTNGPYLALPGMREHYPQTAAAYDAWQAGTQAPAAPASPAAKPKPPASPEYRQNYTRGWVTAGKTTTGLDAAEYTYLQKYGSEWYGAWMDGYMDQANARPKWTTTTGLPKVDEGPAFLIDPSDPARDGKTPGSLRRNGTMVVSDGKAVGVGDTVTVAVDELSPGGTTLHRRSVKGKVRTVVPDGQGVVIKLKDDGTDTFHPEDVYKGWTKHPKSRRGTVVSFFDKGEVLTANDMQSLFGKVAIPTRATGPSVPIHEIIGAGEDARAGEDIVSTSPIPICYSCAHLHGEELAPLTCDAYPDGIPDAILDSVVDHRQPYEDDQGIQFEQGPEKPPPDETAFQE